jgi:hypothetical protein
MTRFYITCQHAEGFSSQAMQQEVVGLLLTVLIISVPPMARMFFQGTLGNFMHFSAFAGGAAGRPGSHGQAPGSMGMWVCGRWWGWDIPATWSGANWAPVARWNRRGSRHKYRSHYGSSKHGPSRRDKDKAWLISGDRI